jgi:23S rRNA (adenine2503-C2)-methyltransferase
MLEYPHSPPLRAVTVAAPRPPAPERVNLLGLNRADMEAYLAGLGEKPFRGRQVLKWLYHQGVTDFSGMTDLSKALRRRLAEETEVRPPEVVHHQVSADGTHKWVLRVDGGDCIETVFIPEEDRGTLCVSSQVGCALDCTFCSTARQGFNRNLAVAEIVGQVWIARETLGLDREGRRGITNVVLMGMGEPLANFDRVVRAMDLMLDDLAFGLARKRVTLSTAGLVPGIDRLRERCPVSLAVSLHAPNDPLRDTLVPINRKYPIAELLAACRRYAEVGPKPQVTFEYVMIDGLNDGRREARELVRLLQGVPSKVNLIPFNPFPGSAYRRSPQPVIDAFRDVLLRAGIRTITRKTRGDDIDAACGQLVGRVTDRSRRERRFPVAAEAP